MSGSSPSTNSSMVIVPLPSLSQRRNISMMRLASFASLLRSFLMGADISVPFSVTLPSVLSAAGSRIRAIAALSSPIASVPEPSVSSVSKSCRMSSPGLHTPSSVRPSANSSGPTSPLAERARSCRRSTIELAARAERERSAMKPSEAPALSASFRAFSASASMKLCMVRCEVARLRSVPPHLLERGRSLRAVALPPAFASPPGALGGEAEAAPTTSPLLLPIFAAADPGREPVWEGEWEGEWEAAAEPGLEPGREPGW